MKRKRTQSGALVGANGGDSAEDDFAEDADEEDIIECLIQGVSARTVTTLTARQRLTTEWEEHKREGKVSIKNIRDMVDPLQ